MTKFVEMMKISILGMVFALMMIPLTTCQAGDYQSVSVTALKDIIGNWYDINGNIILTIGDDYSINSCKILSVEKSDHSPIYYKIKIYESKGPRDIFLNYSKCNGTSDYHNYLVMKLI